MKIKMLSDYVIEIKVKKVDEKRFSDRVTKNFLNMLACFLAASAFYYKSDDNTYDARIACGMSKAIYMELKNAGYYDEGR